MTTINELYELCDCIIENYDRIAVRAQIDGKWKSLFLSELPVKLAIQEALRFVKEGRIPIVMNVIDTKEGRIPIVMNVIDTKEGRIPIVMNVTDTKEVIDTKDEDALRHKIADIEEKIRLANQQIQELQNEKIELKNQLFILRYNRGER